MLCCRSVTYYRYVPLRRLELLVSSPFLGNTFWQCFVAARSRTIGMFPCGALNCSYLRPFWAIRFGNALLPLGHVLFVRSLATSRLARIFAFFGQYVLDNALLPLGHVLFVRSRATSRLARIFAFLDDNQYIYILNL